MTFVFSSPMPDPGALYDLPSLRELLDRPAWHRDAACVEHPELSWFPVRGEPSGPAVAVCAACLVRRECLDVAVRGGEKGVWGGTSSEQRAKLRRGNTEAA